MCKEYMSLKPALLVVAFAVLTAGCTTPQPVLDEAKLTTQMLIELDAQLTNYRKVVDAEDQARNNLMAGQRSRISKMEADLASYSLATVSPVNKADAETYFRLSKAAETKQAALEKSLAPLDPAVLEPLPDTHATMKTAQTALGPLGSELDRSERFKTAQAFVKDLRDGLKANQEKIADASKNPPKSPAAKPPKN